jgi:allantoicase
MTWIKLDAFPDGGVSRFRVWGPPDPDARKASGLRWFNSLPETQRRVLLRATGMTAEEAVRLEDLRPLTAESLGCALLPKTAELYRAVVGQVAG